MSAPAPRSYSTNEVAERLGVTVPTVQRWVDAGKLVAWKTVGGHRRIDAASAQRLFEARQAATTAAARGPSVLIVDDNPDDRDLLQAMVDVALPHAAIRLAENGFDALVAIGQAVPDILVTDIVMPHMDGYAMLTHLKGSPALRPASIIVVSARSALELARVIVPIDGIEFVEKPVQAARFEAALRGVIGRLPIGAEPASDQAASAARFRA